MILLRNRFLNTSSFLSAPDLPKVSPVDDDAGGDTGKSTTLNEDVGAEDDAGDAGGGDNDAGAADDDDPDLADLPPEFKAKVKGIVEKKVAKETTWRDRQIDRLHRKTREAQEDNKALETIADPARRGTAAPVAGADTAKTFTQEDVQREAQRLTVQQQYDRDANDTDAKGKAVYGDKWGSTMAKLPKLGGVEVNDMVDILATDKPHVVLFSLAEPDTYERVMALPPARRRTEFVKLALKGEPKAKTAESKRPADVPDPVVPITGTRRVGSKQVDLYSDKTADEEWYAARNETRRKKFGNAE